jgi:hypothetical protein
VCVCVHQALTEKKHQVTVVENAQEALKALQALPDLSASSAYFGHSTVRVCMCVGVLLCVCMDCVRGFVEAVHNPSLWSPLPKGRRSRAEDGCNVNRGAFEWMCTYTCADVVISVNVCMYAHTDSA